MASVPPEIEIEKRATAVGGFRWVPVVGALGAGDEQWTMMIRKEAEGEIVTTSLV